MDTTRKAAEDVSHGEDPDYTEEDCPNETKCSNCQ